MTPFIPGRNGDPFLSLHRDINRLFDEALRAPAPSQGSQQGGNVISAPINVAETPDEYRVTAELPGLSSDEVEVLLDEDVLTIRGERTFERHDEKENYHVVECSYGTVQRSLRLPTQVDAQQVQASFENGLLRITLPKSKAQDRARRIEVQGGAGAQAKRLGGEPQQHDGGGADRGTARASGARTPKRKAAPSPRGRRIPLALQRSQSALLRSAGSAQQPICGAQLIEAWPRDTRFSRRAWELLRRAYVEARYSKHYRISAEELNWLIERIAILQQLVRQACEARLRELASAATPKAR